jgi:hypothetical protein
MKFYKFTPGKALSIIVLTTAICVLLMVMVSKKNILLAILLSFSLFLFVVVILISYIIFTDRHEYKNIQALKEHVKLIDKKRERVFPYSEGSFIVEYFTFQFPDGSIEKLLLPKKAAKKIFDFININDTGVLTYKDLGHKLWFIGFEREK